MLNEARQPWSQDQIETALTTLDAFGQVNPDLQRSALQTLTHEDLNQLIPQAEPPLQRILIVSSHFEV